MMLGDLNPNLAYVPIVGSDQLTMGLTPSTMHANPGPVALVPVTTAATTSSSPSLLWLALLAAAAWYAWKQGWIPKGWLPV